MNENHEREIRCVLDALSDLENLIDGDDDSRRTLKLAYNSFAHILRKLDHSANSKEFWRTEALRDYDQLSLVCNIFPFGFSGLEHPFTDETREWCATNLSGIWFERKERSFSHFLMFEESDAAMFRLRWGQ